MGRAGSRRCCTDYSLATVLGVAVYTYLYTEVRMGRGGEEWIRAGVVPNEGGGWGGRGTAGTKLGWAGRGGAGRGGAGLLLVTRERKSVSRRSHDEQQSDSSANMT